MARPNNIPNLDSLLQDYKVNICDQSTKIDPDNDLDWFSLCYGWSLAKGLSDKQASTFALHVRYDLHDFQEY